MNNMIEQYEVSGKLLAVKKLKKGDQVKILKGPFASFIAKIEEYEADQRIWILMDLMGRQTKIQTSLNVLQESK